MLRTVSHRELSTGVRALILAGLLGLLLAFAGIVASGAAAVASGGPGGVAPLSATAEPSDEPSEETEEPAEEEPSEEPAEEAPDEPAEDGDDVVVTDDDDGFPLWATVLLVVLGIGLVAAIAYAATRDRDRRDRI